MARKVRFGIFADLHAPSIVYGEERLKEILDGCRKADVDFIIELGDFCNPDRKGVEPYPLRDKYLNKDRIVKLFNDFEKPTYHVLGNHECDECDKEVVLKYYGMDKAYYSFDKGGFHFVVLDNNYYLYKGKEFCYDSGNYYIDGINKNLAYLPKEQMDWLKNDLAKTKNPSIIFAHNWLNELDSYYKKEETKKNYEELMQIMLAAPSKVYMCIYGHTHLDHIFRTNDIWQYTINSASGCWVGTSFDYSGRYNEEIEKVFESVKYTMVYKDALYAIIEMDEDGATVKGVKSEFIGPTPEELGVYTHKTEGWNRKNFPVDIKSEIVDRYIAFINK